MYQNKVRHTGKTVVSTRLAGNLTSAERQRTKMDEICKKLLSHKSVLARILKNCVEEYADCPLDEIEHRYIEGNPQVYGTSVHQDELLEDGLTGSSIEGIRNESDSITEGIVVYDIIFKALNPLAENEPMKMIINIEGQGNSYPGYPLVKRGIYYGGRMISSQYGTVFVGSHYEKLQKVYSIWICIKPPRYRENTINLYSIKETQLLGKVKERRVNYDLMQVVIVGLAGSNPDESEGLIRMLSVMFARKMDIAEKKGILKKEFDLNMSRTMEKEVIEMGSYADWLAEEGLREGLEQGLAQGLAQGLEQGLLIALRNLMTNMEMTAAQAMEVLSIPEQNRRTYAEKLKQQ